MINDRENPLTLENLTLVEAELNETFAHIDNAAPAEGLASTVLAGVVEEDVGDGLDVGLGALDKGVGVKGVAADGAVAGGELILSMGDQSLVIITILYK